MKKISIVSAVSFIFLLFASSFAILTESIFSKPAAPSAIGVGILAASGILALAVRESKAVNILCIAVNSAAMGILIRAWYLWRGFDNDVKTMVLVSLAAALYLWVFFALSKIPFIHRSKDAYFTLCFLYVIISVAVYVVAVIKTETTYLSTFGYYMIIELAFIFAMSLEVNSADELIRNLTLSTYSLFIAVAIAAVVILIAAGGGDCDCDCGPDGCCDDSCCDCLDGCDCGGNATNRKGKKK